MHSHLKIIFKDVLNWLPNSFIKKILGFAAYSDQKKKFSSIYKNLSENKRMSLVGKYPRCTQYDLVESIGVEQILKPQSIEKVCFPEIANLASNCYVKILHGPIKLHQLVDVSLFYKSDVIVGNGVALWEKFFKPQFSHTLPIDYNLATYDFRKEAITCFNPKVEKLVEGLSFKLSGTNSDKWGHFMLQYIPKLEWVLGNTERQTVNLILDESIQKHSEELIDLIQSETKHFKKIIKIKKDETIRCENLIHLNDINYINEHGFTSSIASTVISEFGIDLLHKFRLRLPRQAVGKARRIYIGRGGSRSLINREEIESEFERCGFSFVSPHELTLYEKLDVFSNVEYLAGPFSSGFTNIIFNKGPVKIIGMFNYNRCFDPLMSGWLQGRGANEVHCIVGKNYASADLNQSFYIDPVIVRRKLEAFNF